MRTLRLGGGFGPVPALDTTALHVAVIVERLRQPAVLRAAQIS